MTAVYILLIFAGIILFLILWCTWFQRSQKKQIDKDLADGVWYDERQTAAHGEAYRFSATVGAMYMLIWYIFFVAMKHFEHDPKISLSALMLGGIWLMAVAYLLYCLKTDSAIPLGNYSFPAAAYIVLGFLNLSSGFVSAIPSDTAQMESLLTRLITGTAFLTIGIIHVIARQRNKRDSA